MRMGGIAILTVIAVVLILLGVGSYVWSTASSLTALIPALFGLVLLSCALIARNPGSRAAGLGVAAVFCLLGGLAALWRALPGLDTSSISFAKTSQLLMATALLVAFVVCLLDLKRK